MTTESVSDREDGQSEAATTAGTAGGRPEREYSIRQIEPSDGAAFVSLYNLVYDADLTEAWFDWKYLRNPSTDAPLGYVALHEGELVGTTPLVPFRMLAAGKRVLGVLGTDLFVHPDHRRRGLFAGMMDRLLEHVVDHEVTIMFGFPNHEALAGLRKFGVRSIGPRRRSYRIENPAPAVRDHLGGRVGRILSDVSETVARRAFQTSDHLIGRTSGYDVTRHECPPIERLVSLYESAVPEQIHALRDEALYRWWFAAPHEDRTTWVVSRDGAPVAAILTRTTATRYGSEPVRITRIDDVVPMVGPDRSPAIRAGVAEIVATEPHTDVYIAAEDVLPRGVMRRFGFVPETSRVFERTDFGLGWSSISMRSLRADQRWTVNGLTLDDRSNTLFTGVEECL